MYAAPFALAGFDSGAGMVQNPRIRASAHPRIRASAHPRIRASDFSVLRPGFPC